MSPTLPGKASIHHGVEGIVKSKSIDLPKYLKPNEVLLKITHTSICGTDIHYIPAGIALGHEGVGVVEAVGETVSTLKAGDRAGTGYLRNACGHCKYCLSGREIWCYDRDTFGEKNFSTGKNRHPNAHDVSRGLTVLTGVLQAQGPSLTTSSALKLISIKFPTECSLNMPLLFSAQERPCMWH